MQRVTGGINRIKEYIESYGLYVLKQIILNEYIKTMIQDFLKN